MKLSNFLLVNQKLLRRANSLNSEVQHFSVVTLCPEDFLQLKVNDFVRLDVNRFDHGVSQHGYPELTGRLIPRPGAVTHAEAIGLNQSLKATLIVMNRLVGYQGDPNIRVILAEGRALKLSHRRHAQENFPDAGQNEHQEHPGDQREDNFLLQ